MINSRAAVQCWPRFGCLARLCAIPVLIGFTFPAFPQASEENVLFDAATRAQQLGTFDLAESEFAEFVEKFPGSPRVPEAILFQARAAMRQEKFQAAINLLTTNTPAATAGGILDRYRYWVGEVHLRSSNYLAAADAFASMIRDFPESARLLSAAYGQALAHSKLREFHRTIDLLQNPEGKFQRAAYERPTDELAIRGQLLLAEALLEANDPAAAGKALASLTGRTLTPDLQWYRHYALCRLDLSRGKLGQAMSLSTNLLDLAVATTQPALLKAETLSLQGSIFERAGQPDTAIQVYSNSLAAATPPDRRRAAFLRIIELTLAQNRLTEAAQRLEEFFAAHPADAGSDIALLTLGELHLRQHIMTAAATRTNGLAVGTNHLQEALARFDKLLTNFPQSPFIGHAYLNRGWCFWQETLIEESQQAFQKAIDKLDSPQHLALARLKLADTQLMRRELTNALENYRRVIRDLEATPADPLAAQAFYHLARASLDIGDAAGATDAINQLVSRFPDGTYGHRGALLVANGLIEQSQPSDARALLARFLERFPDSPLRPQVELVAARSHAQEKNWEAAIREYDGWVERFKTNASLAEVEFDRAWVHYLAGDETNALELLKAFVTRFPGNALLPKAEYWIAEFHCRQGNYTSAEIGFQSTNLMRSPLVYQAKMMAGRSAFARHAFKDASDYFTAVVNDSSCPPDIAAEAFFALGDTILLRDGDPARPMQRFDDAKEAFRRIPQLYPNSRLVPSAFGQIANCYFQMAAVDPKYYTNALQSYALAMAITNRPDIIARSQAEVGIGLVLERQAASSTSGRDLLKEAQAHYLNVFNGKNLHENESADPFWVREAGLAAARLAEEQKDWNVALNIYNQMASLFPPLRETLERNMARVREQSTPGKS